MARKLVWLLALVLLIACSQAPQGGHLRGVVVFESAAPFTLQTRSLTPDPEIVPGEVLLGFQADVTHEFTPPVSLRAGGTVLTRAGGRTALGVYVYTFNAETEAATWRVIRALEQSGEFAEVIPNVLLRSFSVPLGPDELWHYEQVGVMSAWESGYSGAGVTVAVVDTGGIPPSAKEQHPDLVFTGGYNFVGRNADYAAAGDHGVHVAGTIGANGSVFSGVAPGVNLVAVRAMTNRQGSLADVFDATWWAGGGTIAGVPDNPTPARVINLSVGAERTPCFPAVDSLLRLLQHAGVHVVVAAGNKIGGFPVETMMPANCPSVITVGAVEPDGSLADYSGHGPGITVMAPGGARTAKEQQVFSTVLPEEGDEARYGWSVGTSMAAPHVAGLIALMLEKNPHIPPGEVANIIQATASELAHCSGCGAGLVNFPAALAAVPARGGTPHYPELPSRPNAFYPAFVVALKLGEAPSDIDYDNSRAVFVPQFSAHVPFEMYGLDPGEYHVLAWRPMRFTHTSVNRSGVPTHVQAGDELAITPAPVTVREGALTGQVWLPLAANTATTIDPALRAAMTQVVTEHW